VTLKTIEGHLARAYTKLGIDRRGQLSQFFDAKKPGYQPSSEANPVGAILRPRSPQSDGGSNDNDRTRGLRKGYRHL